VDTSELCAWAGGLCRAGVHRSPSGKKVLLAMDVMTASWYSPCRKLTTCSSSRMTSSSRTATSARSSSVWAESRRSGDQDENRLETAEGCELIEIASEQGSNLRRQVRGQARQSAQRPRERPLQSSVDVLLVAQLLLQLVDLEFSTAKMSE